MVEFSGCVLDELCEDKGQDGLVKYNFSSDWFSASANQWSVFSRDLGGKSDIHCLEIGSYEGRSTVFTAENICNGLNSRVDALDTWKGSMEHDAVKELNLYDRFCNNLRNHIDSGRVNLYRDISINSLNNLYAEVINNNKEKYDFIYIDGSHVAKDVLIDSVLSWEILKVGGYMAFDDYGWTHGKQEGFDDAVMRPKLAIDSFLSVYKGRYKIIHQGYQVHIKKIKE